MLSRFQQVKIFSAFATGFVSNAVMQISAVKMFGPSALSILYPTMFGAPEDFSSVFDLSSIDESCAGEDSDFGE